MIRANMESGPLPCALGNRGEKLGLKDPVLMMPSFRPRVGKQDEDRGNGGVGGKRIKEVTGLGMDEVKIRQFCPVALALAPPDSVDADINTQAELIGMSRGIGREKMSMPAPNLPNYGSGRRNELH